MCGKVLNSHDLTTQSKGKYFPYVLLPDQVLEILLL